MTSLTPPASAPTSAPEVLHCTSTADFLAALPSLTGFSAPHSLFVVFFSGNRTSACARIDLPGSADSHDPASAREPFVRGVAELVLTHAPRLGAADPALVIASAHGFAEVAGTPWRRLARALRAEFGRVGVRLRELCCVAPDAWVSYLDPVAPPLGRPLEEIAASAHARSAPVPLLSELGTPPPISQATRNRFAISLERAEASARAPASPRAGRPAGKPVPPKAALRALLAAAEPDLATLAGIATQLSSPERWLRFARAFTRESQPQPELAVASERLTRLAALAPPSAQASVGSLAALAWWRRGLVSVAERVLAGVSDGVNDGVRDGVGDGASTGIPAHPFIAVVTELLRTVPVPTQPLSMLPSDQGTPSVFAPDLSKRSSAFDTARRRN